MDVSIVIPTFNRKPILEKCLIALENQKLNNLINSYEVVVVDEVVVVTGSVVVVVMLVVVVDNLSSMVVVVN